MHMEGILLITKPVDESTQSRYAQSVATVAELMHKHPVGTSNRALTIICKVEIEI